MNNLYVLGTIINIDFASNEVAQKEILKLLYELDDLCSIYKNNSDVTKINQGNSYVKVNKHVYNIIKASLIYSKMTDGYEDITVKPLIDAIKNNKSVDMDLIDYKNVLLKEPNLVKLKMDGMAIDLGSMVKGYATDLIVDIMDKYKIDDAVIDLGGNIYAKGYNNTKLWRVGIQNPRKKDGIIGYIDLHDKAIVTSGIVERGYHIVNPKIGKLVNNGVASMTIIANKGIDAEGLSTGLYIMGIDGIKKLNTMKEYAGIMIDDKKVYLTRNLKGKFILKDKKYIVEVIEN